MKTTKIWRESFQQENAIRFEAKGK